MKLVGVKSLERRHYKIRRIDCSYSIFSFTDRSSYYIYIKVYKVIFYMKYHGLMNNETRNMH